MGTLRDGDPPLDAGTWADRVGRLLEGFRDESISIERHIRKAYHLQCLAPSEFRRLMTPALDELQIEEMLEQKDYGRAVEAITGVAVDLRSALPDLADVHGQAMDVQVLVDEGTADLRVLRTLEAWAAGLLSHRPILH